MNIYTLPEFIVNLIGSYLHEFRREKILVRCEYLIKRNAEIFEEVIEIMRKTTYTKREIAKIAEVFFNRCAKYPKNTVESQRNKDYQPNGCEYISYTRDYFMKSVLGNLYSQTNMLENTLKYNLLRNKLIKYCDNDDYNYYKHSEISRTYCLHSAYLLLSVCKYVSKPK